MTGPRHLPQADDEIGFALGDNILDDGLLDAVDEKTHGVGAPFDCIGVKISILVRDAPSARIGDRVLALARRNEFSDIGSGVGVKAHVGPSAVRARRMPGVGPVSVVGHDLDIDLVERFIFAVGENH